MNQSESKKQIFLFLFMLKLILGIIMLMIAAFYRYLAVYRSGGMSLSDDWEVGGLKYDLLVAAFLFVFWMIVGPSDQLIERSKEIKSPQEPRESTDNKTPKASGG